MARTSKQDCKTLTGIRLAYLCSLFRKAIDNQEKIVAAMDGLHLSRTDPAVMTTIYSFAPVS